MLNVKAFRLSIKTQIKISKIFINMRIGYE